MRRMVSIFVALGLVLSVTSVLGAAELTPAPGLAATTADHAMVAARLETQAKQFRANAASHQALALEYANTEEVRKTHKKAYAALAKHCSDLAASYDKAAGELEQMAKIHRELANAPASN